MTSAQIQGTAILVATGIRTGTILVTAIAEGIQAIASLFGHVPTAAEVTTLVEHDLVDAARREVLAATEAGDDTPQSK